MLAMAYDANTLGGMTDDRARGASIAARRKGLGLSVKALAERAGVDRGRLAAIEDGAAARSSTIGAIEAALDRLEGEMSGPYDDAGTTVTFRLAGNFGVDVTVQGPVANLTELEESVSRLIRDMRPPEA